MVPRLPRHWSLLASPLLASSDVDAAADNKWCMDDGVCGDGGVPAVEGRSEGGVGVYVRPFRF